MRALARAVTFRAGLVMRDKKNALRYETDRQHTRHWPRNLGKLHREIYTTSNYNKSLGSTVARMHVLEDGALVTNLSQKRHKIQ